MSYISKIAEAHNATELSSDVYRQLHDGDLGELFEKFSRQELYIEGLLLANDVDGVERSAITVAVYRFGECAAYNASYVFQVENALENAEETRFFALPTIRAAYAFASELELHVLRSCSDFDDPNAAP